VKKKVAVFCLVATWALMLACSFGYEGVNFGSDPDIEHIEDLTATAGSAEVYTPEARKIEATREPEYQPVAPGGSEAEAANAGTHEYSVTATNFDCVCQVDGNVTANFQFNGSQLEFSNPGGKVDVFEKISENTYKRSFMGYYILSSGSGAEATETVVEEEKHVVLILNGTGYVMEHYSGDASSPCCYHTFSIMK